MILNSRNSLYRTYKNLSRSANLPDFIIKLKAVIKVIIRENIKNNPGIQPSLLYKDFR